MKDNLEILYDILKCIAIFDKTESSTVKWMQKNATCGVTIIDCTYREAMDNLKYLTNNKVDFYIRK